MNLLGGRSGIIQWCVRYFLENVMANKNVSECKVLMYLCRKISV